MFEMQQLLAAITGFAAATLQPAAGAQGELAGMLMMRAYHLDRGDTRRRKVLVPDSAHGTNPATAAMCGFESVSIPLGREWRRRSQAAAGGARRHGSRV